MHQRSSYGFTTVVWLRCAMIILRTAIMILVLATAIGIVLGGGLGFLVVAAIAAYN